MKLLCIVALVFFHDTHQIYLNSSEKSETNPAKWTETGIWGPLLEQWALANHRESKVMRLSPVENAFVQEDINSTYSDEKESKIAPGGKIVSPGTIKPGRQVTETDLYLLGAIEKLVYRVDFMEKRLRRAEEMLYFVMAGNRVDTEPCPGNFTRAGMNCYLFAANAGRELDWKAASKQCKKFGAVLAEMESIEENQDIITYIQNTDYLRGKDFWTGGLNPGLLWIWSNSARPVKTPGLTPKKDQSSDIMGNGRCLRIAYSPPIRSYSYRGTDCSVRYNYICELPENTSSNELTRLGKNRNIIDEL